MSSERVDRLWIYVAGILGGVITAVVIFMIQPLTAKATTEDVLCVAGVPMVGQEASYYAQNNGLKISNSTYGQVTQCVRSAVDTLENYKKDHAFQIVSNTTDQYNNSRVVADVFNDYGMLQVYQLKRDGYLFTGVSPGTDYISISAIKPFKPHSSGLDDVNKVVYYDTGFQSFSTIKEFLQNKTITSLDISSEDGFNKYTFTIRNSTSGQ